MRLAVYAAGVDLALAPQYTVHSQGNAGCGQADRGCSKLGTRLGHHAVNLTSIQVRVAHAPGPLRWVVRWAGECVCVCVCVCV